MNVYSFEYVPRQGRETRTVVLPAAGKYADLMQKCHEETYGYVATPQDAEALTADKFRQHLDIFPEGQFMALDPRSNRVAGTSTNMRLDFDLLKSDTRSWAEITNDGWLTTHRPDGEWLYGVDTVVHPDYRKLGVGSQLIEARFNLIRALNLRGLVAGSLIVGYNAVAETVSIEQYVRDVVAGTRFDSNLSKQLHKGFKVLGLIPNYSDNWDSRNWGVEIVWKNPDYRPVRHSVPVVLPQTFTRPMQPVQPNFSPLPNAR